MSDAANNRDEYGVMIGWVGQREHDFGCRHVEFKISDRLPDGDN